MKAVWRSYEALYKHFCNKAKDTSLDGKERATFLGMAKKLENPIFIKNLGLMYDALKELSELSLALQKSDINLPTAHDKICRQVDVFLARKETDSTFYKEACLAVAQGTFKQVNVGACNGKEKEIHKGQFYQALADSISERLLTKSENELCSSVSVLDPSTWAEELSPEYGESKLQILCDKFSLLFGDVKSSYRDFKASGGKMKCNALQTLINRVNTIPVSTAECERGFTKMNIVCTPLRTRLTVLHLSSLMFISITGPPLALWEPLPYVKSWLASNRRDATCTQCPSKQDNLNPSAQKMSVWKCM